MKQLVISLIVLMGLLSGCVSETSLSKQGTGATFPITITDNQGGNVTIHATPERIISIAPSNTEIVFALGLGDRVVGVTEYDDYPIEATEKEKIGGFSTVNIEKVVSLNPDIVFATGGVQAEVVQKLKELGLTVVVMDARDIDAVLENIILVGEITGKEVEAESLVGSMRGRIETVKDRAAENGDSPTVAYLLWGDPLMVAGGDTFIEDLIEIAGGENIFSDSALQYPKISMESMIERNPEILINGDHSGIDRSDIKNDSKWMEIAAAKSDRIYTIDADLVNRQGPRVVDALELFSLWIIGG